MPTPCGDCDTVFTLARAGAGTNCGDCTTAFVLNPIAGAGTNCGDCTTAFTLTFPSPTGPVVVQSAAGGNGTNSISVNWPAPTTAGSLLFFVLAMKRNTGGVISGVSVPAGLTLLTSDRDGTGSPTVETYYKENAASQSNSGTFSFTSTPGGICLAMMEVSGIQTSSPLDGTPGTNNNTTGNPLTGVTTTTHASDILLGGVGTGDDSTLSSPTNGFTLPTQAVTGVGEACVGLLYKIVTTTQVNIGSGATQSGTGRWAGGIGGFKAV